MLDQIYREGFHNTNTDLKVVPLLDGGEGKSCCSTSVEQTHDDAAADTTNIPGTSGNDDTISPFAHAKIRANHIRNSQSTATT